MSSCCRGIEEQFDDRHARRDLRQFRRNGPRKSTRLLIEAVAREGIEGATLLDIGGGVGAISHALLERGLAHVTDVDASRPFLAAARTEAERRGTLDRFDFRAGDFTEIADSVDSSDVVTLDRVICCYPDAERLISASASRARRVYALVFPRSGRLARFLGRVANGFLSLRRCDFRVHIHDTEMVEALVRRLGFERRFRTTSGVWQIFVYRRESPVQPPAPAFVGRAVNL